MLTDPDLGLESYQRCQSWCFLPFLSHNICHRHCLHKKRGMWGAGYPPTLGANLLNLLSPLINEGISERSCFSKRYIGDSLSVGVSAAFFIHITWATSAILCPLWYIDPSVIVSRAFATQQFSRHPYVQGSELAYGCRFWLSRACWFFFLLQLFLASKIAASISLGGCVKLTFFFL